MRYEPVTGVQPEIFRWARVSVGLSVTDVAAMLKRDPEEVAAWEAGTKAPTYPQLERLAYQVYKRPLAVFFLPSPPEEQLAQREFRTLPEADMQTLARDTYLHIWRAHAYQLALRDLFDGHNPAEHLIWKSLSLSTAQPIAEQADRIRQHLGITLEKQIRWANDDSALKGWRKAIEDAGVFVFKAVFKQKEISGFCLADDALPLIYLNNSTTKTRQIFSLLHELAHLLLSMNGLSKLDTRYIDALPQREQRIERFCNAIAAEALIPTQDFAAQTRHLPVELDPMTDVRFSELASRYGVSREAILRRFLDEGRVGKADYERMARIWSAQKKRIGRGNWYNNQGAYLSERFTREVVSRHYRNQLTLEQASELLGIKPKSFAGFEERVLRGAEG